MNRIFLFTLLLASLTARSQNNSTYLEYGGPGKLLSYHWEVSLSRSIENLSLVVGTGVNFQRHPFLNAVPFGFSYLVGGHHHFLDIGAGASMIDMEGLDSAHAYRLDGKTFRQSGLQWFGTANIGYRYVPWRRGIFFRTGLSSYWGRAIGVTPYISLGFKFF